MEASSRFCRVDIFAGLVGVVSQRELAVGFLDFSFGSCGLEGETRNESSISMFEADIVSVLCASYEVLSERCDL